MHPNLLCIIIFTILVRDVIAKYKANGNKQHLPLVASKGIWLASNLSNPHLHFNALETCILNCLIQEESSSSIANFVSKPCTTGSTAEIGTLFSALRNTVATSKYFKTFETSSKINQLVEVNSRYRYYRLVTVSSANTAVSGHLLCSKLWIIYRVLFQWVTQCCCNFLGAILMASWCFLSSLVASALCRKWETSFFAAPMAWAMELIARPVTKILVRVKKWSGRTIYSRLNLVWADRYQNWSGLENRCHLLYMHSMRPRDHAFYKCINEFQHHSFLSLLYDSSHF